MSVPLYAASDAVSSVLGYALDGIAQRQRVIADNIANIDTPGFRATAVDFESSLQAAISGAGPDGVQSALANATPALLPTNTPVGANGNDVDLRKETLAAMQSQFQYQMVARAVTDRFDLVKTAAGAV
ncbi:flagellar basal body rod protein FlgB [Nocardioides sp. TRM66260-LWL]|uniref:flagellar basal body rod protein FlgB n=1 Tax=Nocardioides sp. TRM66260-LWL TaxID=2874478 RepID=UPI001CC3D007|nr:flagellar basal body rod protein FlgB [Nocardioides sp. TRM66260-LWL]MBZ5735176.1 flagellar basal body rod protein FlgB [Nocardioides sp. TRM66260-LWL]